jgi:uncharacterized protein YndB with AHSA1/START domain
LTVVERVVEAAPARTFAAMSDAWLIPVWVVGATHVRDVDESWPAPGARLHHKVGAWPLALSDSTGIVTYEPPWRLVLQGRAYPFGEVRIELTVTAEGERSKVCMGEAPTRGLAYLLDSPALRAVLRARNRESLDRLAAIAEHRRERSEPE